MPWTASDAKDHSKDLTAHQSTVWSNVANSALAACLKDGGKEADCAAAAIRQANAMAAKAPKVKESFAGLLERGRAIPADTEAKIRSALASIHAVLAKVALPDEEKEPATDAAESAWVAFESAVAEDAVEVAEADLTGDLIPLVEKAIGRDGQVNLKLIQAGWGSSGHYSAEMLKRDGPKVFTKGLHCYLDHPSASEESDRPERSVKDIAAVLTGDARWEDGGAAGAGLYATATVRSDLRPVLEELAPHIGVSIRALGRAKEGEAEGRTGPVIEAITAARSADFVTVPGAGGKVLSLFEAARGGRVPTPATPEEGDSVTEAEARALQEANTAAVGRIAQLEARLVESDARALVTTALAASGLPAPARTRLAPMLATNPPRTEAGGLDAAALTTRVTEAVTAERAYIAEVGGAGAIRGMGASAATEQTAEQREAALSEGFARLYPALGDAAKIAAAGR